jgi:hypothetical protein
MKTAKALGLDVPTPTAAMGWSLADMAALLGDVRSTPESRHQAEAVDVR